MSITSNPTDRTKSVGGSDIAAVLSLPPWGCARRLYYQKTGTPQDRPFLMSGAMTIGTVMEEWVAKQVEELKGWRLIRRGQKKEGWESANIDREIQKARETPGIAEIKVVGDQTYWNWIRGGVSLGYLLQLQWYMAMHDRSWGAIIAWNRDAGGVPSVFEFDYDHELVAQVREAVAAFWQRVESGDIPDPLDPRDERCEGCEYGAKCREDEWTNVADNGLVQIEMPARWNEFRDLDAIEKDAAKAKKELRPEIDKAIGDNEVVRIGTDKVVCRPQETWRLDIDRLKLENPELAAAYMYRSMSRPLRVYPIKEKK